MQRERVSDWTGLRPHRIAATIFNMTTLTLTLDDAAAAKARQAARRRQSSLEDLLQRFVVKLGDEATAEAASGQRESAAQKLIASFRELSRPLGGKGYASRDELYER
jgi:hypothetical protein